MGLRSRLNIGGADVDTQLHGDGTPGGPLNGVVVIQGGKRPQEFRRIYISIETSYKREDSEGREQSHGVTLMQQDVSGPITVQPGQRLDLPVSVVLPPDTPLTLGRAPAVRLRTGLDVEKAIDPKDSDVVHVVPNLLQRAVLDAMDRMGMRLHEVEHEHDPHRGGHHRFVQELEFKPFGGHYQGRVDEVELVFRAAGDGYDVHLEVDRRRRGFRGFLAEVTDRDETRTGFRVGPAELAGAVVDGLMVQTLDRAL
jgi:sporulation-control protein